MSNTTPPRRLNEIYQTAFANYRAIGEGQIRSKGRAKPYETKLKEEFAKLLDEYPDETFSRFREEITERVEDVPLVDDKGCTDRDAAVDEFLSTRDITISDDGKEITMGPHTDLAPQDLKDSFKDYAVEKNQGLSKEDTKYSGEHLYVRFAQRMTDKAVGVWKEIMTDLEHCPAAGKKLPANLATVLQAIRVNPDSPKFACDRRMFAHFMWTVKRRILKLDFNPALPVMLVLQGRQGGGKTSFIENHLGSVFRHKVSSTDLSVIHDSREFKKWVDNAIVNFDELSMRGLADGRRGRTPDLLKQLLTSSHSQERTFFTQSQQTYRIRASFMGSCNKRLQEYICDPTGMRRYWELNSLTTEEEPDFDWDVLENFDWLELWKGVDEDKKGGYIDTSHKLYPKIEATQDTYCVQPSLRRWFEEHYDIAKPSEAVGHFSVDYSKKPELIEMGLRAYTPLTLYSEYADAMRDLNNYAVNQSNFIGQLAKMGVPRVPKSRSHPRTLYFVVKPHQ